MKSFLKNIFLIDDDPIHLAMTKLLLDKYITVDEITTFTNAGQVINFMGENAAQAAVLPDMILLDLDMPIMNGWEFLESLDCFYHSLAKQPTVLVLSSSVDDTNRERLHHYKTVKNFISKPLSPENIRTIASMFKY